MFDFLRTQRNHRRTQQQVASLDNHMRRDIGMLECENTDIHRDPILLLSRGPFERYVR